MIPVYLSLSASQISVGVSDSHLCKDLTASQISVGVSGSHLSQGRIASQISVGDGDWLGFLTARGMYGYRRSLSSIELYTFFPVVGLSLGLPLTRFPFSLSLLSGPCCTKWTLVAVVWPFTLSDGGRSSLSRVHVRLTCVITWAE